MRYPFGAAATRATPSTVPNDPAISCAITRGAFRSRRASSNATGVPRSPRSRVGGYSSGIGGASAESERVQLLEQLLEVCAEAFVNGQNHAVVIDW